MFRNQGSLLGGFRALIPARSQSKGIKDKNLLRYQGFTLLEYSIAAARVLLPAEDVWVSTDSESYADLASAAGASVHFIRPAEIAQDHSTDFHVFSHALDFERLHSHEVATHWLHLRPTTPIRDPSKLLKAVDFFLNNPNQPSSLRSIHKSQAPVFKWCRATDLGLITSLSGDPNVDLINLPRQDYEPVFIPNGYIDIIKASSIVDGKFLYGKRCLGFLTEPVSDIDEIQDMTHLMNTKKRALTLETWLHSHYGSGSTII